jgi:hypothetical protein
MSLPRKRARPRRTEHPMTALLREQAEQSAPLAPKRTEASIASLVVAWLENAGHDVYQEVDVIGGVADIVTLAPDGDVWIVETKMGWSLDLLEQCCERRHCANRVYAAVPVSKADHRAVFRELGIGVLVVDSGADAAKWNRTVRFGHDATYLDGAHVERTRSSLCDGHKTHAKAGAPSAGGRFTTFRGTAEALAAIVASNPGVSLRDAVASMNHHYTSPSGARANLAEHVRAGRVPGVTLREVDGVPFLFLAAPAA